MATLTVKGSLELSQFWPDGTSDADTIKVRVQSDSFLLTTDAGQEFPTDVFATACMNVKGTIKKVVSSTNTVTIRLQGIDAPELHYPPHNYRQYYGKTAVYQLGLGLKKYGKSHLDCIVRTDNISSPNDVFDMYGRFVGDVILTEGNDNLNINLWLVEHGWAFPAFYATMTPEEIATLAQAGIRARDKKLGIWRNYSAELVSSMNVLKYQSDEAYSAKDDKGTVHFPKVFRRYCAFLEDNKAADGFGDYLSQKSSRDKFFEVNDFLDKHQSTIKPKVLRWKDAVTTNNILLLKPEELVFVEGASTLYTDTTCTTKATKWNTKEKVLPVVMKGRVTVPAAKSAKKAAEPTKKSADRMLGFGIPAKGTDTAEEKKYTLVRIFFGTDRNQMKETTSGATFGKKRSTSIKENPIISYGTCDVTIPRSHKVGVLESPSIFRLEFRNDITKHLIVQQTKIKSSDQFFKEIQGQFQLAGKRSAFIFIHGYNVSFEDAARRTAQMLYDLEFQGAAVFYSWPSQETLPGYTVDEQTIEWSQTNIKNFLHDFCTQSTAEDIYIIAHSMGNRGLTRALKELLQEQSHFQTLLKEIILAAPDIDAEVFQRDIAPAFISKNLTVTLYASSNDKALNISKTIHGYPRAGDAGDTVVVIPPIETIDASDVDTDLLGHSYFASEPVLLSDIRSLIAKNERAKKRGLEEMLEDGKPYWKFRP